MRHILHDIKKLETVIIQQGEAHDHQFNRHQTDAEEFRQQKEKRRSRPRTALSDNDDEYQPSKGRNLSYYTNPPRSSKTKCASRAFGHATVDRHTGVDRAERRKRLERMYDNLEPLKTRRSSRWNESTNDENGNNSAPTQRRRDYPSRLPGHFAADVGTVHQYARSQLDHRQTVPQPQYQPVQQMPPQQPRPQQHPQPQAPQQFYPQRMHLFPRRIPPPQSQQRDQPSAFRPIQQMAAPVERHPLVFVPIDSNNNQQRHQQQRQQQRQFRSVSVHSTDVATRRGKVAHSHQLFDAVKLAEKTKTLAAQIQKRQTDVIV